MQPQRASMPLPAQVAWACRILAMEQQNDLTLGHVSAREPGARTVYMKRKGVGLDEVTVRDVLTIDLEGRRLGDDPGEVHLEYPLHTAVYHARPDVGAVIHVHPRYATALGATSGRLELLTHYAVLFAGAGLPRFTATPDLVTTLEVARQVAQTLGRARAVLLRNHGVLVVGKDVPWAVVTALSLERALELQMTAATLGPLAPMTPEEAAALVERKFPEAFVAEYWEYLMRRARRSGVRVEAAG